MTGSITWAKSPEGQGAITLITILITTLPYFVLHMKRHNKCETRYLFAYVVNIIGFVTGIYIFWGAFDVIKTSLQNGIWGGITGVVLALWTLETIITDIRNLLTKKEDVTPQKQDVSERAEP
jgi:hypothetical protein